MDQTNSQSEKPRINIGTIGHPGHGKTTLTQAITRYLSEKGLDVVEEDTIMETIGTGFPRLGEPRTTPWKEYETENRRYAHTDWPEDAGFYVKELVRGTRQLDGAILVVAAFRGIMPQTREHLFLAQLLGVPKLVVFMNKTDLVEDPEHINFVKREIRALLDQYHFDRGQTPIIEGSARKALRGEAKGVKAIAALMDAVERHIPVPTRMDIREQPFLMPVEDVFSVTGRGTVVTGRIERGIIKPGDPVEIIGMMKDGEKPLTNVVHGIEIRHRILDSGEAGDTLGILLKNIDKDAIHRGMVICQPGSVSPCKAFKCEVYNARDLPAVFKDDGILEFRSRTASVLGQVKAPQKVDIGPTGSIVCFEVILDKKIAMEIGLSFVILENSQRLGFGKVTEILA